MTIHFNSELSHSPLSEYSGRDEEDQCHQIQDILQEARAYSPGGLTMEEIHERLTARLTRQTIDELIHDGEVVNLACCDMIAISSVAQSVGSVGCECGGIASDKQE